MICPIIKKECRKKSCAWYSKDYESCTVLLIGDCIADISVIMEDKGVKVELCNDD